MHRALFRLSAAALVCFSVSLIVPGFASAQEEASAPAPVPVGEQAGSALDQSGAGDLLVAPTRVVLEGRKRATEIVLNNRGDKEATYRLSLIDLKMDENGKYVELKEGESTNTQTAEKLVRFSPRQVTLKPRESQTVKVMMRKPEGLADGEYRSHLLFRAVPDLASGEDVEAQVVTQDGISIRLIPVYGVSIPVIVREGTLDAKVTLSDVRRSGQNLLVTINRTGTKSIYGDVIATQGSDNVIAQQRGVAVLMPNAKRHVSLPLSANAGNVTIEFRERAEEGGNVLATANTTL